MEKSNLQGYCDRHCPADWRADHDVDTATAEAKEFYRRNMKGIRWGDSQQAALEPPTVAQGAEAAGQDPGEDSVVAAGNRRKKAQVQRRIWRLPSGAPIVPHIVYTNVETTLSRWGIRKRKEFVSEACKYWTLKREARGGAALLKRLQQQLETFTSMEMTRRKFAAMGAAGGPKLQKRIDFATALEGDLGKVMELSNKALEREELKMQDAELLKQIVDTVYFPIAPLLWPILERSQSLDSNYNFFKTGLYEVQGKLQKREYATITAFTLDFGKAFHDVVFAPEAQEDLPARPSEVLNEVTTKPKDLRKEKMARAKRIIRAVQFDILEAARKVADLSQPLEDERRHIEAILEHCLSPPSDGNKQPNGQVERTADGANEASAGADEETSTINSRNADNRSSEAYGDVEMADAENNVENLTEKAYQSARTVPILLQITSEDDLEQSKTRQDSNSARGTPYAPELSNGGGTNAGSTNPGPPTPPHSEKELSSSFRLAAGGVPWYMSAFEPEGTTVYDEQWANQEALRGISEELSELDDDIVNGLVDNGKLAAKGAVPDMLAVPSSNRKRPRPKRKR
jgi:NuA3 HAT complex component NTO1